MPIREGERGALVVVTCARAAHEANLAFCLALGERSPTTVPWESAPGWQRSSCMAGVEGALAGATPEESHASWLETKRAEGWRWGPEKNADAKTHPCFLPYEKLPPEQRAKDELYLAVVRAVARALGEKVSG